MFEAEKKDASERDRELFLGHLVTWGSIIIGLGLAIALAPMVAGDQESGEAISAPAAAPEKGHSARD